MHLLSPEKVLNAYETGGTIAGTEVPAGVSSDDCDLHTEGIDDAALILMFMFRMMMMMMFMLPISYLACHALRRMPTMFDAAGWTTIYTYLTLTVPSSSWCHGVKYP